VLSPAEARDRLRGVVVPTVTPFDASGRVALDVFRQLIEALAAEGASAVIPGDLVGEQFALTPDERRALLAEAVAAARGRMLVIALTAAPSLEETIGLARFARDAGADLIKLGLPYPWTPEGDGILDLYRRIDDAVGLPFLVESSDDLTLPVPVIAALCDRPTLVGLEEIGSSLSRLDRIHAEFAGRLALLPSGDNAYLYLGLRGAPATITAESNFAARAISEFLAACRARDLDRALDLFARRRRYRDLFRDGLAGGRPMFVPYTKAAMEILGTPVGPPRPPQRSVPPTAIAPLREALRREFGLEGRPPA
jgi:4-hydroxy-tetrahydrodipicolinate synthase